MNYIGSKVKLLSFIEKSILSLIDKDCKVFCDLFAGTGVVGANFKQLGFKIISNDIQYYSYALNKQLICNHKELKFDNLIDIVPKLDLCEISQRKKLICDYLTKNIRPKEGFISKNYSPTKQNERMYLTNSNARKCDAIRVKIEDWKNNKLINDDEYFFLIASLIKSIDRYANVVSVYGAFLKKFKENALKEFIMRPHRHILNDQEHKVFNEDANKLIKKISTDILYIDPPYNNRQYATNYHLLETIARYDKPKIYGKTGLREYSEQKSKYCLKNESAGALKDLIEHAKAKYIFISYNNEGIIPQEMIKKFLQAKGEYGCFEIKYSRYKADLKRNYIANSTIEYLHYCKCT